MKRLGIIIFVLTLTLTAVSRWLGSAPSYNDPWPVDPALTAYYKETYEEARAAFRTSCENLRQKITGTTASAIRVQNKAADDLTIDTCLISGNAAQLLIVTSGIHGGEAYASSAVQRMFMDMLAANGVKRPDILLVHAINPFGMKYFRRVTENNVDLNRNFDTDTKLFAEKNAGYTALVSLLNPTSKASLWSPRYLFFPLRAIYNIVTEGMSALRQAILQGQYEHSQGVYFGGKAFEQQKALLDPVFLHAANGKKIVTVIDLHTGYGERGTAHLFPNIPPNNEVKQLTEKLFAGYKIDWPGGDFYATHGDFSAYLGLIQKPGVKYIPMVFEYGTLDSQTTRGSIVSIQNTILENQAFHHGCASVTDCQRIKANFREMFFPSSLSWRSKILRDSRILFQQVLQRMSEI